MQANQDPTFRFSMYKMILVLQYLINSINDNNEAKLLVDIGCALRRFANMGALKFVETQEIIGCPQERSVDYFAFWQNTPTT